MHCLPRRLEEKHQHAAKVLDNKESAFWEETVGQEKAKRMAGQGLGHSIDLLSASLCIVQCSLFIIGHRKHTWNPSVIESFFADEVTGRIADQNLSPHTWRTQNHEHSQSRLKARLF